MKTMLRNFSKKIIFGGVPLPVYIISTDPIILISYCYDFFNSFDDIAKTLPKDKEVYALFHIGWERESIERANEIKEQMFETKKKMPNLNFVMLCNSPKEVDAFTQVGIRAILANHNAFVDPKLYPIDKRAKKKYDAIYVARITPFKRHELAVQIDSLLYIGTFYERERKHVDKILHLLRIKKRIKKVHPNQIYKIMNSAKVGLCLSAKEGAMFASIEYLLCGIPIVSTASIGGRDLFFDDRFVKIVNDTPEDVAKGVNEIIALDHNPEFIRKETIAKMEPHKQNFIALINDIYKENRIEKDFANEWDDVWCSKFGIRTPMPKKPFRNKVLKKEYRLH